MKLIGYELRKIFTAPKQRWICLALALLSLALTAALSLQAKQNAPPREDMERLLAAYETDAQSVASNREKREALRRAYEEAIAHMSAEEAAAYPVPTLPDVYALSDDLTDEELYAAYDALVHSADSFGDEIDALLLDSYGKYQAYLSAGTTNHAALELQYQYIRHYQRVKEVTLPHAVLSGWDTLLLSPLPDLLCGLMILMLISPLFTMERAESFSSLQRTCRRGRRATTAAKLAAALACTWGFTLLMALASCAVVSVCSPLSDPSQPVQSISALRYCPWVMSVSEYWGFSLLLKLFSFSVLALTSCAFSALAARAGQALLPGLALWIGCGIGLYLPENTLWAQSNLLSLAMATVGQRYRGYGVLGLTSLGVLPLSLLLWSIVALAALIVVLYGARKPIALVEPPRRRDRVVVNEKSAHPNRRTLRPHHALTLTSGELHKLLTSRLCLALMLLLCFLTVGRTVTEATAPTGSTEAHYRHYTLAYQGEITPQTIEHFTAEKQEIDDTLSAYESTLASLREGHLSQEEWQAYILRYADAFERQGAVDRVLLRLSAAKAAQEDSGERPWLLYDTGWQRRFAADADVALLLIIAFLSCVLFPMEHRRVGGGAFYALLSSTKRGRGAVVRAKCLTSALVAAALTLLLQVFSLLPLLYRGEWIAPEAPLSSLGLGADAPQMTVAQYLILCIAARVVLCAWLAVIISLLSRLYRRELYTLLSACVLLFLPRLLTSVGLRWLRHVDLLNLYALTPFLRAEGAATALPYLVLGMLVLPALLLARPLCHAARGIIGSSV